MNCQEITDSISSIKAQLTELDSAVDTRNPEEAIKIKNDITELFDGELIEFFAPFYRDPTPENYDKEVERILNKIRDRDPSEVLFSRVELILIYDTNDIVEYGDFNRESVSKIEEIREKRKLKQKEDAPIVLDCQPEEIAWGQEQINQDTKIYIGPLFPEIFNVPINIDNIYITFPEGKIGRGELTIGGKSSEELGNELVGKNIKITSYAKDMLHGPDFTTLPNPENINLIRLRIRGLNFPNGATTQEIYDRAKECGLDLCPAEVGPYQLLKDAEQPMNDLYNIAMDPIGGHFGPRNVFRLRHNDDGLCLDNDWFGRDRRWGPDTEFMFLLRPSTRA